MLVWVYFLILVEVSAAPVRRDLEAVRRDNSLVAAFENLVGISGSGSLEVSVGGQSGYSTGINFAPVPAPASTPTLAAAAVPTIGNNKEVTTPAAAAPVASQPTAPAAAAVIPTVQAPAAAAAPTAPAAVSVAAAPPAPAAATPAANTVAATSSLPDPAQNPSGFTSGLFSQISSILSQLGINISGQSSPSPQSTQQASTAAAAPPAATQETVFPQNQHSQNTQPVAATSQPSASTYTPKFASISTSTSAPPPPPLTSTVPPPPPTTTSSLLAPSPASSNSPSASAVVLQSIPQSAAGSTYSKVWQRFWDTGNSQWNDQDNICGGNNYSQPVVWEQAVIGRAVTNWGNTQNIQQTIADLENYRNPTLGVFSATEAKDQDIYNDDNSQVAWVYTGAYQVTQNPQFLSRAQDIVGFLTTQWNSAGNGGVFWKYKGTYIASISTIESALAAMRVNQVAANATLVTFAENCMNYAFQYLQDPSDDLFYDGVTDTDYAGENKGKLTYTVGTAISTLVLLNEVTGNSYWLDQAVKLGSAATNKTGAFYGSNGYWNNDLEYVHLLFDGLKDLVTSGTSRPEYSGFSQELIRQGGFIYNFLQDPADTSLYFPSVSQASPSVYKSYEATFTTASEPYQGTTQVCPTNNITEKKLMDNASVLQILQALQKVN